MLAQLQATKDRVPHQVGVSVKALLLLGRWGRVGRNHVPLNGFACACSLGIGGLSVEDFELDLLDYLYEKHGSSEDIESWFKTSGYVEARAGTISALLQHLVETKRPPDGAMAVLGDMEITLASFAAKHMEATLPQ